MQPQNVPSSNHHQHNYTTAPLRPPLSGQDPAVESIGSPRRHVRCRADAADVTVHTGRSGAHRGGLQWGRALWRRGPSPADARNGQPGHPRKLAPSDGFDRHLSPSAPLLCIAEPLCLPCSRDFIFTRLVSQCPRRYAPRCSRPHHDRPSLAQPGQFLRPPAHAAKRPSTNLYTHRPRPSARRRALRTSFLPNVTRPSFKELPERGHAPDTQRQPASAEHPSGA